MTAHTSIPGLDGAIRDAIHDHVFSNADREVGGVLVGRIGHQGGPPLVLASIEAMKAAEERASLTFTQDTWKYVHAVIERHYAEDQIVGWYHSHPGFGIFLSEHDLFIHRHFFSDASQIALVIDPLAGTEGVFGWQDGDIAPWYERPTGRAGLGRAPVTRTVERLDARRDEVELPPAFALRAPVARSAAGAAPHALSSLGRHPHRIIAAGVGLVAGVLLWEGALRADASVSATRHAPPALTTGPGQSQSIPHKPPTEDLP